MGLSINLAKPDLISCLDKQEGKDYYCTLRGVTQ